MVNEPMQNLSTNYKYLWALISAYVFITVASDLNGYKIVEVFGVRAPAGILFFSLTYFFIEIITEVYGYKRGRIAIWNGALFCGLFIFFAEIVIKYPSHFSNDSYAIYVVISGTSKIFMSTIMTVIIAEHVNAYLLAKLKIAFDGKYIGIRFISSSLVATGVSMFAFIFFAFYGRVPHEDFIILFLTSWFYRYITELLLVPFFVKIANNLKRIEKTDIHDLSTNYNMFKFDNSYDKNNNYYIEI